MELFIVILLVGTGILLILLEFLVIPGIAVAGIGGVAFMIGGIIYSYKALGTTAGNWTFLLALIAFIILLIGVLRAKTWKKAALETEITGKVLNHATDNMEVGDVGETLSRLAPMGKIKVNGQAVEAKSLNGFIDPKEKVEIVKVENTNVIVKHIKS